MSSSDDENPNYQPVLAVKTRGSATNSPGPPQHEGSISWPKDGVNMYANELFTDGDVLGHEASPQRRGQGFDEVPSPGRPSSSTNNSRMGVAKGGLAARRAERLMGGSIERNDPAAGGSARHNPTTAANGLTPRSGPASPASGGIGRNMFQDSPSPRRHGSAGAEDASFASSRSDHAPVYTLPSTFDPNADDEDDDYGPAPANAPPYSGSTMPANPSRLGNPQRAQQQQQQAAPAPVEFDLDDLPSFLNMPGPKHGPIQCYIVRDKTGGPIKSNPRYTLFLEDGKRFLIAARKRKMKTTSNYVMSLDYEDVARESDKFFGKLRSNFVGTEFTVYSNGDRGGSSRNQVEIESVRNELACVTYQYNVLGTRGPRKMTGVIPCVDAQGQSCYQPRNEEDTLLDRIKNHRALNDLMVMHNKPPRWNEELNAYCLNFNGRVTEASVKNFQLITDDNQNHVILQFGKVGKHMFTMDYQWPISAVQAFGICLSSFDNKLACE